MAYVIRGALIALRREQAEWIRVKLPGGGAEPANRDTPGEKGAA